MDKTEIHLVGLRKSRVQSVRIGYIEDFDRIKKLKEIEEKLKAMGKTFRHVGLLINGGTYKNPALKRLRDDLALEILNRANSEDFSLVEFFKKYDMGKFLSVNHGCCKPCMMVHDVKTSKKRQRRSGPWKQSSTTP